LLRPGILTTSSSTGARRIFNANRLDKSSGIHLAIRSLAFSFEKQMASALSEDGRCQDMSEFVSGEFGSTAFGRLVSLKEDWRNASEGFRTTRSLSSSAFIKQTGRIQKCEN
jgi:hypothetical protein